ncbi:hypothetical protein HKD37_12G033771 [Glycine soja]
MNVDYCDGMLALGSYNATYDYYIHSTKSQQYWVRTPYEKPKPPPMKRRPGRPKKAMRNDTIEGESNNNRTRMKRNFPTIT